MTDSPPQGLVDAVTALHQDLQPKADVSDQVARNVDITFCFGAKDSPIIVGDLVYLRTSFPARINGWAILSGQTGSVSFTVKACLHPAFIASPAALTSIVAAANPAMTTNRGAEGDVAEVSTWTTVVPRNTSWEATVDSISGGIEELTLSVRAKRLDL